MIRTERFDNATLYLGDCRDVIPTLDAETIGAVLTDPPYSSGARRDSERQVRGSMLRSLEDEDWFTHDAMTTWGFGWFIRSVFSDLRPRLAKGAHVYVCIDWRQTPNLYGLLEASGYRVNHCLVWNKRHFGMGAYWRNQHENIVFASNGSASEMLDHGRGSVINCEAVAHSNRRHPTEKPVALFRIVIGATSAQTILDPFMGSGTTGVACAELGRTFVGVEIDPEHFDAACRRIDSAHRRQAAWSGTAGSARITADDADEAA